MAERHITWESRFHHAAIMRPLVRDPIVAEVSSHTTKLVPVQSYNSFPPPKGLEKSLYDFTGTIFAACVNSYVMPVPPNLLKHKRFAHKSGSTPFFFVDHLSVH